jgi:hypothetical protein
MKTNRIGAISGCIVAGMLLSFWTVDAVAQRGRRGGNMLAPEKQEAAWTLQAQTVAKILTLDTAKTGAVTDVYKTARKDHQAALRKMAESGGQDRSARFEAFRKLGKEARGKLEASLKGVLDEKQAAQAFASMGTFDRRWDQYVDVVAGLKLGDEKQDKALRILNQQVIDSAKVMKEDLENRDWESMRAKRGEMKKKLDAALAKVLSEEEQAKWSAATASQRRRR